MSIISEPDPTKKVRLCNKPGCMTMMRPTREFSTLNRLHRLWRCPECGNVTPWLEKPFMNGSFAELHCIEFNQFSGYSMMSDPIMYPPKSIINRPRRVSV